MKMAGSAFSGSQSHEAEEEEAREDVDVHIPEIEKKFVNQLLDKFVVLGEKAGSNYVNVKLMMRNLGHTFTKHNFERVEMVNFMICQKSLIAFQNDDMDELFNFYDARNKGRFGKLRQKTVEMEEKIGNVN